MNKALTHLFMQLSPQDVEQFHQSYQRWMLEQQIEIQQSAIAALEQKIAHNVALMEQVRPSAIALSTLAQLQASGVEDIALLDQMLERGEAWLDRTMQQLEYCERMDLIGESYTEWCQHALEGAYDWIESLQQKEIADASIPSTPEETDQAAATAEITENLLIQKLMSDEETEKTPLLPPRITVPLPILDELSPATDLAAAIIEQPSAASESIAQGETIAEASEISASIAPEATEVSDSLIEATSETIVTVEPSTDQAETIEVAEATKEQDNVEPDASSDLEVAEPVEPAISQAVSDEEDITLCEPEPEEQIEEITSADEGDTAAIPAEEMEQDTELVEFVQVEDADDEEPTEVLSIATTNPAADATDVIADETIAENEVAEEVPAPEDDAVSTTDDAEDILTTVQSEEEEETQNAPSGTEPDEVGDVALPSIADSPPQQELLSPSSETDTQPHSTEATQPAQEQRPKQRPSKKRGFFRRLLAFLLS